MRTLIVYHSLSGTTAKAASGLAELLGADLAEIRCDRHTERSQLSALPQK